MSTIRKVVIEDYLDLYKLTLQLGYKGNPDKMQDRLIDMLKREDHIILIAEVENQTAAWIHGYLYRLFYTDLMCEIGGLVVDEDYRRMGIGRQLMKSVEKWARKKDCTLVSLRSNIIRENAHEFYEDIGYELIKTQYRFIKKLNN